MGKHKVSAESWSEAQPEVVFGLLREGASWPTWSPLGSFELEREGRDGGESLGAIRLFRTGRYRSHEEIVALDPNRRFSYGLVKGLPLRGYRADIDLEERDGGTAIRWRSSFDAKVPGTGWIYRRALSRFIRRCVDGLAAYAAAPHPSTEDSSPRV